MTTVTSSDALAKALGRIASGIYVVTTGSGTDKQGMLASFVMQTSFQPPTVIVCVQHDREILKALEENRKFVINVLHEENSAMMGRFGKFKPDQFDGLPIEETEYGIVLKDTVAYLGCEFKEKWNAGDHAVVLGEVMEGEIMNGDMLPWTHLRKNGLSY